MKKITLLSISVLLSAALCAQKRLSIDNVVKQNPLQTKSVSGINWMNGGKFYTSLSDNKIIAYDIAAGTAGETIFDGNASSPAIGIVEYAYSADEKKLLLLAEYESIYRHSFRGKYYVHDIAARVTRPLTGEGKESYAAFSPDGAKVAFVRNNNLYYATLADMKITEVTTDGAKGAIINGSTDWAYEEEFGFTRAFYWSPDSKKIAYYRFDESAVKEYNMQLWTATDNDPYPAEHRFKYPKAGEQNATIDIYIYHIDTKEKIKADLGSEKDIYIPRAQWTNQPQTLSVRRMNRLQNQLDYLHVDAATGKASVALTEKSDTFVDLEYADDLIYLKNSPRFIISSERNGWKNLYLYDFDGKLVNAITQGVGWEVAALTKVDEKNNAVYFLSTEGGHLSRTFWSAQLNGKKKTKLSAAEGMRSVNMSADCAYYLDYVSAATQPLAVSLYQTKGNRLLKVLENNETLKKTCAEYGITNKEFFTYLSADGVTALDGYFVKPDNFDASKKYPVLVYQYSGPRVSSVSNSFGAGRNYVWFQYLAQQGILVAAVDTRGTGFRGEKFVKQTYKNLGKLETEDLLAAAKYLGALPYVDKSRLALHGWSYGGYMTATVMTHQPALVYAAGIAGAPVVDFRLYDTIYTERYMQTPALNPQGYARNPVNAAADLKGDFLLVHGTGDDNVHFQNAALLENALIKAGKQFRAFAYPDQPHGFRGTPANHHLIVMMTEFLQEKLKP